MAESIRHREVSRIEGFSDTVFGFALTLLVVSLEAPKDVAALRELVKGLVPFALMFAMVVWIWYEHNILFRRYGMQDVWTVFLNAVLLFVVLFYVYPLKFLTNNLFNGEIKEDSGFVMLLYSAGVLAIFLTFALLYHHAWRQRLEMDLTPAEQLTLRFGLRSHVLSMSVAGLSLILVAVLRSQYMAFAGLIYFLMGPLHAWNGYRAGVAQVALRKAEAGVSPPAKKL